MNKIFIILISGFFFWTIYTGSSWSTNQKFSQETKKNHQRQLRVISLSGSGYELGLQHGRQLKGEISEIIGKWERNTKRQVGRDAKKVVAEFLEYARFSESIKKWTPNLYEEVRGIADGSGQDFNSIFVLNLLDEFWVYLVDQSNHHCSAMGVSSEDGNPAFVAQNMDLENYTDGYQTLIRLQRTEKRPEQLILTLPGLIALNGINETGIGVCVNTLMQLKASNDGLPVAFAIRRIINSTKKYDVLEFITSVNHASGQNYMIGIRDEIFDFEASANKVVQYNPDNTNGTVYHTNHPLVNSDLKEAFKGFNPVLADSLKPMNDNSYLRFQSVEDRLAGSSVVDPAIFKAALRSKDNTYNPVCVTNTFDNRGFTFASTIMMLTGRPFLLVTAGPPDESDYQKFEFTPYEGL